MRANPLLQTEAIIGGTSVTLARPEDRHALRQKVEEAARTSGRFVDIEAADGSDECVRHADHPRVLPHPPGVAR